MILRPILTVLLFVIGLSMFAQSEGYPANYAKGPRFKALLCYEPTAEEAHVQFDKQAIDFFHRLTYGEGYILDVTTDIAEYVDSLQNYSIIIMCNYGVTGKRSREAFQNYMEHGGGWMGFHASAFRATDQEWPWMNKFLGCGAFLCNQWPPQAALVEVDNTDHPITRTLPAQYVAPASEYYQWTKSPRLNKDVEILVSISPRMYPFGIKDVVKFGDFPIVWTNRKYRMVYLNMGHGNESFIDATQNLLYTNAFRWIVSCDPKGNPFEK